MSDMVRAAMAVVALGACAPVASAQTVPGPTVPGPTVPDAPARQTRAPHSDMVVVTIDVDQAYDENVVVQASNTPVSLFQGSGPYTMLTPSVDFAARGQRVQLAVNGSSNARYYSEGNETIITNHRVGAGLTAQLSSSTSMSVTQMFAYSPALLYGLFGTTPTGLSTNAVPRASDYALNNEQSYESQTGLSLTHRVGRRTTLMASASHHMTNFTAENPSYPDVRSDDIGGRITRGLSRNVGLRLGYTFRRAQYSNLPESIEHNLDVGMEFSHPLSATRRSVISFSVGPTVAHGPLLTTPTIARTAEVRPQYRLVADANATYPVSRVWTLEGAYHRGIGYIAGFNGPVFTSAFSASGRAATSRRTSLVLSAAYSTGDSVLTGGQSQFKTSTVDAKFNILIDRNWAAYVEYLVYQYDFRGTFLAPPGIPPVLTRNGLRTGIVLRLPARSR